VTAAVSLAFTAAYQLSRRLWLPMDMHFAWNYLFSAVFSVPVSGHEANGWLHGSLDGPEWLSDGAYGAEASVMALVVWVVADAILLRRVYSHGKFIPRPRRANSGARSPKSSDVSCPAWCRFEGRNSLRKYRIGHDAKGHNFRLAGCKRHDIGLPRKQWVFVAVRLRCAVEVHPTS
jgi:hypothetical protein